MTFYELWETGSRNLIGEFDTLDAAIAELRASIAELGNADALRDLALGEVADDGKYGRSWSGADLAALARETCG